MDELLEQLQLSFNYPSNPPILPYHERQAAVLVLLFSAPKTDQLRVILTKRAAHLRHHPGEIALPGGRCDSTLDCDIVETALRETKEEIGVDRSECQVVGGWTR